MEDMRKLKDMLCFPLGDTSRSTAHFLLLHKAGHIPAVAR